MEDIFKKHGFLICSVASLALGAILFLLFYGFRVINPLYTDWMHFAPPDMIETYLGWHYYMRAPWEFPLGLYDSLSYPIKTTILNTDSIPLFAIPLKLFKNIMPADFQYWGIYVLLCYMFQSFLGMLIIRKFTKNDMWGNITAILAGVLICLMPSMTLKVFWHTTSAYHFILLAALIPIIYHEKFSLKTNIIYYGFMGFLCGSTQPYILVIDGIILSAYCLYKWTDKKDYKQFLPLISFSLTALIVLYLTGAFIGTYEYSETDLFDNNMNLNSFFNSHGYMTFFRNFKTTISSQFQGFAYYGIGIMLIMAICLYDIIRKYIYDKLDLDLKKYKKEMIFIIALIVISFVLAISPQVTFSDIVLFEVPLPDVVFKAWSVFRCTGRFIWIANYIILILAFVYFINHTDKKKCAAIMLCCIALQLWDFYKMVEPKMLFKQKLEYKNDFDNDRWNDLYNKNTVKNIYWDMKFCDEADKLPFTRDIEKVSAWAKNKDIKFNCYYFARRIKDYRKYYSEKLQNPNENDIFIFLKSDESLDYMLSESLKHYYLYDPFVVARTEKILGWDDIEIPKENLKKAVEEASEAPEE